jgi:diguanylate cyclase (GGDEF)-like protein
VNDQFGHIAGDGVLRQLAALVRRFVRGEDVAARIGGEEFAVLLPESDLAAAHRFAERLREEVASEVFMLGGAPKRITISIGVAALADGRTERGALMKAADEALYRAKDEGRNRVCVEG